MSIFDFVKFIHEELDRIETESISSGDASPIYTVEEIRELIDNLTSKYFQNRAGVSNSGS